MKTWILEKREARYTAAELRRLSKDQIANLEEAGIEPEELGRWANRYEALSVLDVNYKNEIDDNGQIWDFVEYGVAEYEIDEDGEFISGGDYWSNDRYRFYNGECYVIEGGDIFGFQRLWYAILEDEEDADWGTGSFDYDDAVEMAKERGYSMIAVIKEAVEYGEVVDTECIEELHAGEDF